MPTFVFYHDACADGFGAAYAAWKALGDGAVYQPVQYSRPVPEVPEGSSVYVVDFSWPREQLEALNARCGSLVVLDHHKTAEEALRGLPYARFDQSKSGAVLTWEHFHPDKPLPALLAYVQDRDLWKWELPDSKEVSAGLRSHPFNLHTWDNLAIPELVSEGLAILRFQTAMVEQAIRNVTFQDVGGYEVPVLNATAFISEIGERLCFEYGLAPFSATFFIREDGKRVWSLRSRNGFDVSAVAKAKGGGGHAAAAGFVE